MNHDDAKAFDYLFLMTVAFFALLFIATLLV